MEEIIKPKSVERQMVEEFLKSTQIGQLVTYEQVEKLTGEPCGQGSRMRSLFQVSIKEMVKHKMVFECIPNEGYVRLDDDEISAHMLGRTKRVRRASEHTVRIGACVDLSKISPQEKNTVLGLLIVNRFVTKTTSPRQVKRIIGNGETKCINQVEEMKRLSQRWIEDVRDKK